MINDKEIENPGKFLGYTQGDGKNQKPTLYFENGRLTQEHDKPENVGWHPHKGTTRVVAIYGSGGLVKLISGDVDPKVVASKIEAHYKERYAFTEDKLVEFDLGEQDVASHWHRSRGILLQANDHNFDQKYGTTYATSQIENATLADNEQ